jgi:hypothetical protein
MKDFDIWSQKGTILIMLTILTYDTTQFIAAYFRKGILFMVFWLYFIVIFAIPML